MSTHIQRTQQPFPLSVQRSLPFHSTYGTVICHCHVTKCRLSQKLFCKHAEGLLIPLRHFDFLYKIFLYWYGPGSSVGIATNGLGGMGIESRWGARFPATVHTGPGVHPAPCTIVTRSFPGVKSGRDVTLTPHPLLVPLVMKE